MGGQVVKLCDSIMWALWHLLLSTSVDAVNVGAFRFLRNVLVGNFGTVPSAQIRNLWSRSCVELKRRPEKGFAEGPA